MKKSLLLFLALFLLTSQSVSAAENWVIKDFHSSIDILKSGEVKVEETIKVDFGQEQKHGIFRDIPLVYQNSDGSKYYTKVEKISASSSETNKFTTYTQEDFLQIKIGDPDKTISGTTTYHIKYSVKGVLSSYNDFDEFYWNVTGNYWPVPIHSASATITLPEDGILKTSCYIGGLGSAEKCSTSQDSLKTASITSTRAMSVGEGITAALGYKKGLATILKVEPLTIWDQINWLGVLLFILPILGGMLFIGFVWWRQGRDFWHRKRFLDDPLAKEEIKPLGGHETIVIEFEPPDGLRPAEVGVLADEKADTLDVTATIIDLAQRGFLTIKEVPKKWLFGETDYILEKAEKTSDVLLDYEKLLLERLFEGRKSTHVSTLKKQFYEELKEVKTSLYKDVTDKKFFAQDPEKVRLNYLVRTAGLATVAIIIVVVGLKFFDIGLLIYFAFGSVIGAGIAAFFSRFLPRRTAHGREIYRRVKGYELFISRAEKYRQIFFEKRNLFNEVLPYAIVFGLTKKFAKAFNDMDLEPPTTSWYVGAAAFNATRFSDNINTFSSSLSSAIASTPTSSGSGGGGFSGGGFGGGGGGSW